MDKKLLKSAINLAERIEAESTRCKLSADAFVRQAVLNASTDDSRLDALKEKIEKGRTFRWSQGFYRASQRWIAEKTCSMPPKEERRLSWLGRYDEVRAELAAVGSTPFELFALAARTVAKERPEVFGDLQDIEGHAREVAELKAEYAESLKRIESGYNGDDLIVGKTDSEGRARVSFRLTDGVVHLGPDCGQHLVDYLRSHPRIKL